MLKRKRNTSAQPTNSETLTPKIPISCVQCHDYFTARISNNSGNK